MSLCVNAAGTAVQHASNYLHISISFGNKFHFLSTNASWDLPQIFFVEVTRKRKVLRLMLFQRLALKMLGKWILRISPIQILLAFFCKLFFFRCWWNFYIGKLLQSHERAAFVDTFDTTKKAKMTRFSVKWSGRFPVEQFSCFVWKCPQKLTFSLIDFHVTNGDSEDEN